MSDSLDPIRELASSGVTKTNALCRAQTMLTQYLNRQGEIS